MAELELFDTHAHYDDSRFDENRESLLETIFRDSPVRYILNAGTNYRASLTSLALAERYDGMYASVGVHPSDVEKEGSASEILPKIEALLAHPKAVAIGEIGLDYHYDDTPRDVQMTWFRLQMEMARRTGYPVIIHDREAHGDCLDVIRDYPDVVGILHSFSGSAEMVTELVRRGWYISFSGVITFKNASKILEAVKSVPDDRLLIETDSPYLAPVPMRGQANHSDFVIYTAQAAAQVRGQSLEQIAAMTTENGKRIYRISNDEKISRGSLCPES